MRRAPAETAVKSPRGGVFAHVFSLNYTTVLNIIFLAPGPVLVWRFLRTGGQMMLRMMGGAPGL